MRIAIIGAGISGLRAGLELVRDHDVTIFEKSAGVGGRVATRRVDGLAINHGSPRFDRIETLGDDPFAYQFHPMLRFTQEATALPKAMRDELLSHGAKLMINTKVTKVEDRKIHFEDRNVMNFEAILLTPPLPQVRELVGGNVLPHVEYTKEIMFIGVRENLPVVEKVSPEIVDEIFDLSEEEIRSRVSAPADLSLKKWRYARIKSGSKTFFCRINDRMLIAGDAFDPTGTYDMASAWISGRSAGKFLN